MQFTSIYFIIFFMVVFVFYYLFPKKMQWICLLVASIVFYCFSSPKFLIFILTSSFTTYFAAKTIGKIDESTEIENKEALYKIEKQKRFIILITLLINFGILCYLKYANFVIYNLNGIIKLFGMNPQITSLRLILPLGISFYTFQTAGYIIDVYRGIYKPEKSFARYLLFTSFFPHILQGPIARYEDLSNQLFKPHNFDYNNAKYGLQLVLWGYFKKFMIADQLGIIVNNVFGNYQSYAGSQFILAVVFYAIQIYADFSGCMDMARGVAQTLGINLAINFERPYFSASIAEFWRRWHITLGAWFRDYLFYSLLRSKIVKTIGNVSKKCLGKKRGKNVPTYLALVIVWFTTGLWHGAAWHYVFWGCYFGFLIIASMIFKPIFDRLIDKLRINTECWSFSLFRIIRTFTLVCFGYIFFRADNLSMAFTIIKSILTTVNPTAIWGEHLYALGLSHGRLLLVGISILVMFIVSLVQSKYNIREKLAEQNLMFRWFVYWTGVAIVLFAFLLQNGGYGGETVRFIYMQF